MKKIYQQTDHDCLGACICSILDLTEKDLKRYNKFVKFIPHPDLNGAVNRWFRRYGWQKITTKVDEDYRLAGLWIASVKNRDDDESSHCVIFNGTKLCFNPNKKDKRFSFMIERAEILTPIFTKDKKHVI